jgi:hypothetical protein
VNRISRASDPKEVFPIQDQQRQWKYKPSRAGRLVLAILLGLVAFLVLGKLFVRPISYTPEEFKRATLGLSTSELRSQMGSPDSIEALSPSLGESCWVYQGWVRTENNESQTAYLVIGHDGRVSSVFFR